MRLVKLSDLSEEERKKALEEQQERLNKNRQEAQNIQKQSNNDFNNYVQKQGTYDTNQHTTSIGNIKKAYKNTSSYNAVKSSLNNYYNNNNTSIWNDVKSTFNNLMLSGKNGVTQMFKGAETQLESNKNYKMRNKKQFYTSRNVSDIAKAQAKTEDNSVLNNMIKNKFNSKAKNNPDYGIGNIDLNNRPIYQNEDGSISTVRSMSFWDNDEQKEILVPTIAFDKDGKAISLTDDEAVDRYYETGEYLGKFDDWREADKYAERLHEEQDKLYSNNNQSNVIEDKSPLLKINDGKIDDEIRKYKNSISNGKIDTNLTRNYLQNNINKTSEEIQKNTNNINNEFLRKANEQVVPALGQMGAGMIASAINPALGTLYFTESAVGSYYDDAKQRGMSDSEARKYSTIMGAMEGATEQIGIGNIKKAGKGIKLLIKGTGKEAIKEGTEQITKTTLKSVLKDYEIGIADNVIQEALIDPIQELTAQTVAGKDKAQWEGIGQKMLQDGINGGLVSAILGGANLGIQSCTGVVEKVKNNQQFTQQEVQMAVQDASKQLDVGQMITDSTQQQISKYKDYYTGKTLDNNTQNILNQAQDIINNNTTQNLQQNTTQNQIKQQMQQITQQQDEMAQNENIEQNIANKQERLYNNFNESESGYNERNNGQTIGRNDETTRLYKESEPQQTREYSWEEYNKWEQSVKPIETNKLTDSQKKSVEYAKKEYNKDVVLYNENENDNTYSGGASKEVKGKITISKQSAEEFGLNKIIDHENLESDILHNENTRDILSDVIEMIQKDEKFNLQKEEFWKGQEGNIPTDYLIAKDIICDRFSEIRQKEKLDYENVLSNATKSTIDNALVNYYSQVYGKELEIPSSFNLPTKEDKKLNLPTKENINQTTQGEKIDWNEIERPEGKIRKHYRSIIESSNTTKEAKAIAKELMGTDTYVPETNKGQLAQADYRINNSNPEAELKSLMNRVIQGEKISSVDIAVGERLIQYYSKTGDKANLQDAIQTTAMAGTSAGQTVQALAMLNHQTPEGQATWIQRSVDKMNNELAKRKGGTITKDEEGNIKVVNKKGQDITDKVDLFELTPDMIDKIVSSKNKTEMYDNIDQVYEDLGQQVPLSTMEKIDSWRYFSMLANPKTHIRNMVGNVAMGKTQSLKDKLAGGIEDIVGTFNKDMERTKTLRPADAKTKEFAKNDVLNPDVQSMMELNENKYNPQSRLQNARKTFKNDALENTLGRLFNWNDKLLEAEDALGLKSAYKKALTDYLTANKIDVDNITDKQLSKARNYAVEQAKEATFHQANSLATWINQASTNNKIVKGAKDAILPFVKTPLNVAKTGIEYNPVGLLKTITYDTVKLRKGEITVNKYIDNLSKGLTGTGIAVLGYALADAGILKASGGDDDKKEKYDEALGKQTYSITIGDRTYSLDWLAPVGIPLFVGAEAKAMKDSNKEEKSSISSDDDKSFNKAVNSLENLANAMANSMSPMSEMSMISGLTSALKSYEQDSTKMLGTIGTNAIKSYANQFVPTLLGQVARTTDDYERSTTSTKSGVLSKAIDQTKLQIMSKVPGLRQKLSTKTDIWGNEQKAEPNIPLRVVNNFVNPSTVKNINTSKVDEELDNLYNKTGESTILPATIDKKYTINGQTYRMTDEEYAKYKKDYGQTSYKLLDDLINSNDYNKLSDDQKQKAIENIYSYAKETNKVNYAKNNNETVKTSTLYDTLEELKQKGGNQSSYLNYIAKTKDITGEDSSKQKIEVLANSNYTDKTKEIIYKNTEGSKDKKITVVDKLGLPINEYLKYKSQKFESDKDEDGETVKGSKNQKVYNYLNNIPDEDLSQDYKKIICKMSGINSYDKDIVNLINNNKKLTVNERTEILTNIGFKIDKQGRIQTSSVLPLVKYVK